MSSFFFRIIHTKLRQHAHFDVRIPISRTIRAYLSHMYEYFDTVPDNHLYAPSSSCVDPIESEKLLISIFDCGRILADYLKRHHYVQRWNDDDVPLQMTTIVFVQ